MPLFSHSIFNRVHRAYNHSLVRVIAVYTKSNVALWRLTVATPLVAKIRQHRMLPKLQH